MIEHTEYREKIESFIKRKIFDIGSGFYFVAGVTNSGKSTTLDLITKTKFHKEKKVFKLDSLFSSMKKGDDIYAVVTSFLKADPDAISVDELRRKEEFQAFFKIGARGYPMFATLHVYRPLPLIEFLEQFAEDPLQLKEKLKLIICTELIPKKCTYCDGKGYTNNPDNICEHCKNGRVGVLPVYEIIYFNHKNENENGFDARVDNIYDFETLAQEGKIIWIKQSEWIEEFYQKGLVFDKDYNRFKNDEKTLNNKG